ncbi:MAG TPA: serine hydrolase domain-containing protein [Gemmatimonadota bacterium]|nr:serine hydrolase domain-containing protein [Gemmatimonadota bacterium]
MTARIRVLAALLGALLHASPGLAQATIGGDWRADVARFAQSVIDAGLAPGMGVAVSQDDRVLYTGGFGVADAASGRGVGEDTAFYMASSTKALTATAVTLLAERGEIDLAAPVTRYLPDLAFGAPLAADSVTIERLLTMTHGIEDGGPVVVRTAYSGDFTAGLLIDLLAGYGPAEDGRAFNYGNLGYNILGMVLAPGTEHGWKDVVRREVLEPLGMASTTARVSELDPDRIALPHNVVPGEGFRRISLGKTDANLHAAGGHFTTAGDLARFVAAHASGGRLEGERAFPAAPIAATHERRVPQARSFGPYRRVAWGYGWDIAEWEGKTIVQRFGSFAGYRSHMSFEPVSGVGVVVLVNGGGPASPATDLVASYVYDRMLGRADLEAEYARRRAELEAEAEADGAELAAHLAERRARLAPLPHPLEAYAGDYESPRVGRIEWRVVAGGLEARMGVVQTRAEVFDAAANRLRIEIGGGVVAEFEFPPGGGPAGAVTMAGERFERVGEP